MLGIDLRQLATLFSHLVLRSSEPVYTDDWIEALKLIDQNFAKIRELEFLGTGGITIDVNGNAITITGSGGGGVTDHGALTGLGDDDHPQYLTQAEGDALYDPLGSVPSFGSPTASIDIGDLQADGAAVTVPRSDHQHAFSAPSTGYPVDADFAAEADGSATTPARSDHRHHVTTPSAGYPVDVDMSAEADGTATTPARSDHRHHVTAPSTGYPVDVDMSAEADGTNDAPARADHKHHVTSPSTGYPQDIAGTEADGTSDAPARADHVHKGVVSVNGVSGAVTLGGSGGISIGRPNDPLTTLYDSEEFLNNIATSGSIGKLGWAFVNSSVSFIASEANHVGIASKLQNNNAGSLNLGFASATGLILPAMFFDNYFIVRPQSFDGNCSLWIGYQDSSSGTGEAGNMILFEALTTDTNWFTVTRTGSGTVQRQDTTIACTTGNWYVFRIRRIDASTIGFTVVTVNGAASGVSEFTETSQIPTVALGWALRMRSHTAANRTCEIDFWDQLITGMAR